MTNSLLASLPLFGIALVAAAQPAAAPALPLFQPKFGPKEFGPKGEGFGPKKGGRKIGAQAPDFELKYLASDKTFKPRDNFDKRPTVLLFHSFT